MEKTDRAGEKKQVEKEWRMYLRNVEGVKRESEERRRCSDK